MATAGSTIAGAADRHVDLSDDTTRRYQAAASLFQMFDKDKDQELRGNELRFGLPRCTASPHNLTHCTLCHMSQGVHCIQLFAPA